MVATSTKGNKKKSAKQSVRGVTTVPKTVQQSIPYVRVYDDANTNGGVIETVNGVFTKSYLICDTNFSDAGALRQDEILKEYEKILSTFNTNFSYQITINKRNVDPEEFNRRVLLSDNEDKHDSLRHAHNDMIIEKMQEGNNNLTADKYLTIAVNEVNIESALKQFTIIERDIMMKFKKINQIGIKVLSLKDRLEILHDIYNMGHEGQFENFYDINAIRSQGISTKDIIGPSSFDFKPSNYFKIDEKYVRVLYMKALPSSLSSDFLEAINTVSTNIITSVYYDLQPQDKAVAFVSGQLTNIGGDVVKAQSRLTKSGAMPDNISSKLDNAQKDAREFLADLTNGDQLMFHVTVLIAIFADNKDDLDMYTEQAITRAKEKSVGIAILTSQQEQGFNSVIPLAYNQISAHRIMTTTSASAIQPFSTQELQIKGGFYYGLNQLSKNLIIYNRSYSNNQNGVILGSPGAGKSFAAKMEMYQALLSLNGAQIFIIDPEREYKRLGDEFDADIFYIMPGGQFHINPLDLNIEPDEEGDPFATKVDFVISIIETMLGGRAELNGYLKSIVDNTLKELYAPYIAELHKRKITFDPDICPTLQEFYNLLRGRKEPEAKNLAASIQMYCVGTLNLFAHRTNINTKNRFIIYDTKNIGTNLKELGMQVCLNDVWNRMIENRKRLVRTWFYIDEFYLLLKQPSAAAYLQMIWKRARKWMGSPTGITQNVSDLIATEEGQTILATSDFALILKQAFADRMALQQIYELSDEQVEFLASAGPGEGLLYTSRSVVPFENLISESSPIYKLLTTKADDDTNVKHVILDSDNTATKIYVTAKSVREKEIAEEEEKKQKSVEIPNELAMIAVQE